MIPPRAKGTLGPEPAASPQRHDCVLHVRVVGQGGELGVRILGIVGLDQQADPRHILLDVGSEQGALGFPAFDDLLFLGQQLQAGLVVDALEQNVDEKVFIVRVHRPLVTPGSQTP